MARVGIVGLLCLALVLSGCVGFSANGTPTDGGEASTATPRQTATNIDPSTGRATTGVTTGSDRGPTAAPTPSQTRAPEASVDACQERLNRTPGAESDLTVEEIGIKNGTLVDLRPLVISHYQSLNETGFRGQMLTNLTYNQSGTILVQRNNVTVKQSVGGYPARSWRNRTEYRDSALSDFWTRELWENRTVGYIRASGIENRTAYLQQGSDPSTINGHLGYWFQNYFEWGEHDVTAVESTADGCRVTLELARFNETLERERNVTDYSGTVVVDAEGRIRSIDATFSYGAREDVVGAELRQRDVSWRLTRIGNVTVERPAWFDDAVEFVEKHQDE